MGTEIFSTKNDAVLGFGYKSRIVSKSGLSILIFVKGESNPQAILKVLKYEVTESTIDQPVPRRRWCKVVSLTRARAPQGPGDRLAAFCVRSIIGNSKRILKIYKIFTSFYSIFRRPVRNFNFANSKYDQT